MYLFDIEHLRFLTHNHTILFRKESHQINMKSFIFSKKITKNQII